jgi:hypothetical protein
MNFMAGSSSSLGLASHFNPKRGGTKAQQTVIWAMKLAQKTTNAVVQRWCAFVIANASTNAERGAERHF